MAKSKIHVFAGLILVLVSSICVAQNHPFHTSKSYQSVIPQMYGGQAFAVYDLNNDGSDDLITIEPTVESNEDPQTVIKFYFSENGILKDVTSEVFSGDISDFTVARQSLFADFNGDGVVDIFLESHGFEITPPFPGGQNYLLLSQSEFTWTVATQSLPQILNFSHGSALGDLDNDGDVDILMNDLSGPPGGPDYITTQEGYRLLNYILKNDGDGTFTVDTFSLRHLCADYNMYWQCGHYWSDIVDANGDGRNDVYLAMGIENADDEKEQLIALQNPDGSFSAAVANALPEPAMNGKGTPGDVFVHDVDQDGLDDLILVEGDPFEIGTPDVIDDDIRIFISNGDGTFRDESHRIDTNTFGNSEERVSKTYWRDFDEDGHLDFIIQRLLPQCCNARVEVYLNNGKGYFRALSQSTYPDAVFNFFPMNLEQGDKGLDMFYIDYARQVTLLEAEVEYGPIFTGDELANRLVGGARDEEFNAGDGDDIVLGGVGADLLQGGEGNDSLSGEDGDDVMAGGNGTNTLNGGEGYDIAVYGDSREGFTISQNGDTIEVKNSDSSIVDTLTSIESIQFGDGLFSLTDDGPSSALASLANAELLSNSFSTNTLLLSFGLDAGESGLHDVRLQLINDNPLTFTLSTITERTSTMTDIATIDGIGTPELVISIPSLMVNNKRYTAVLTGSNSETLSFELSSIELVN